jgi:hypothetical protein
MPNQEQPLAINRTSEFGPLDSAKSSTYLEKLKMVCKAKLAEAKIGSARLMNVTKESVSGTSLKLTVEDVWISGTFDLELKPGAARSSITTKFNGKASAMKDVVKYATAAQRAIEECHTAGLQTVGTWMSAKPGGGSAPKALAVILVPDDINKAANTISNTTKRTNFQAMRSALVDVLAEHCAANASSFNHPDKNKYCIGLVEQGAEVLVRFKLPVNKADIRL